MNKHKTEVFTVKTHLKVKFQQAVIAKIMTLPPVILKMFQIAV